MRRQLQRLAHLLYQILDLLQVSIDARTVQRRLTLLVPFVPLKLKKKKKGIGDRRHQNQGQLTNDSPFLSSSALRPSCHNPPNHHLETIWENQKIVF